MPKWVRAFCITLVVYAATAVYNCPYDHSEHLIQAWQWLHGKLWVDGWDIHEVARYGAHQYIVHPPLPSIVDLPFVALLVPLHIVPRQVYLSIVVGAATSSLVLLYTDSWLLWAFFSFGTVFWYEATLGTVWGFCLVLSCFPTLMALRELDGEARPFRVGLWASLAATARYDLFLCWPIYLLYCVFVQDNAVVDADARVSTKNTTKFTGEFTTAHLANVHPSRFKLSGSLRFSRITHALYPMLATFVLYALWNEARFHSIIDRSIMLWYAVEPAGQAANPGLGMLSLHYLPFNIYTALFMAPSYVPYYPWVVPTAVGQSLLLTSPAFLLALQADWRSRSTRLLWLLAFVGIGPSMLVWANGTQQFGARYWIQVYPFFIALLHQAQRPPRPSLHCETRPEAECRLDQLRLVLVAMSVLLVANGLLTLRF